MSRPPTRRIVLFVVAVGVAAVCVRLGIWQLDRLEQRRALNASIEAGLSAPPSPLPALLTGGEGAGVPLAYRRTTLTGTYDLTGQLRLYGRPLDGRPGDHLLTPLVADDGTVVLVDRGWIPSERDPSPTIAGPAAPPEGRVTVEGILLPAEGGDAFGDEEGASTTLVRSVDVEEIDARIPGAVLLPGIYLLLQDQTPAQDGALPEPVPLPELDEGPHMSYAIQWFVFAAIALVGYGVLLRRDRREERAGAREEG